MNAMDLLSRWSTLSLEEIAKDIEAGENSDAIEQLFGADEAAELQSVALIPQTKGLRGAVVLLPGFMGSVLRSIRGMTSLMWINPLLFLKGEANLLELNREGTRDAAPQVDIVPVGAEKMTYLKIGLILHRHFDLYEFPYDWRRRVEFNGDLLNTYIERWAADNPDQRFTLVGHSMGGLVARAYMARHTAEAERRVKRLIMLGTPHFGLAGAVENVIKGNSMTALAGVLNKGNDLISVVRNLPSIFQGLPAPPEFFPSGRPYPVNWDIYDAPSWQLEGVRQELLDGGRQFYELLASVSPQVEMIEIAGCNLETVVDFKRSFDSDERPIFEATRVEKGPDSGDATVPLWSAELPEARIFYVQEVHRDLPKRRPIIDATLKLIHGDTPDLPTELPERKSGIFGRKGITSVEEEAKQLKEGIESGTATVEDLASLYFAM
jgi:pimeloyl-ACP methyl ester carboxylesterase